MRYVLQGDGRQVVTTAGTPVQLGTDTNCAYVLVQGERDNGGDVVVGASTVVGAAATRRGLAVGPGELVTIFADNLADVWLDADTGGDGWGVTFVYFTA
jgi:hypothetical protein